MQILYRDTHLLAVDKPAGVPSQPDDSGDPSLVDLVRETLGRETAGAGKDYLGLLHRLDRPTSGLILLARNPGFAAEMAALFRDRKIVKTYLAAVECLARPGDGEKLEHFLAPGPAGGMRVYRRAKPDAKAARLAYQTLWQGGQPPRALLSVELETGVKHQIRAQLAFTGLPVIGDFRYGPLGKPARPTPVLGGKAILLHAHRLAFIHPVTGEELELASPPPPYWRKVVPLSLA